MFEVNAFLNSKSLLVVQNLEIAFNTLELSFPLFEKWVALVSLRKVFLLVVVVVILACLLLLFLLLLIACA